MEKNIRIKMKSGKTRLQRVKVLASGKYKFIKNKKSRSSPKKARKTRTKKRNYKMARKKKGRRSRKFTIPMVPVLGVLAATNAWDAWGSLGRGEYGRALEKITAGMTGYSTMTNDFSIQRMKHGLLPIAVGLLVHKFVGGAPLNANRMLASANVPLIRI